jgi:hypothetical protein
MQQVKKCNHISTTSAGIGPTYTIQGGLTWDHYLSLGTQFHLIYLKVTGHFAPVMNLSYLRIFIIPQ